MSYKRVDKPEAARQWKFDVIAGVIGNAFRLFLENVAPDLLCDAPPAAADEWIGDQAVASC